MSLFGKSKTQNPGQPKRRSVLGILFNPEIGASMRSIGESTSMFVKLVAMIFAMNGLFPKNHPALLDEPGAPKLSLSGILHTAWGHLSFTKEGLPKVVLFFAVAGTMLFSVLAVITFFLMLFVGHAHAQTTTGSTSGCSSSSFFTPCDPTNDLAQGWMNFLFKNQPLPNYVDQTGTAISQYTGIQQALMTALGFYSNAILILAAIILFYHLVSMVVETAHHGVAMGKRASQIWAPIRLVVAIGLLVPVGSAGLNTGQYIVIQMAEWGSGLGSNVWSTFVSAFKNDAYAAPPAPYIRDLAEEIVRINACEFIVNAYVSEAASEENLSLTDDQVTQKNLSNLQLGATGTVFQSNLLGEQNLCGSYVFNKVPAPPQGTQGTLAAQVVPAIYSAHQAAFESAFSQATSELQPYFQANPPNWINGGPDPASWSDVIGSVENIYDQQLSSGISSALSNLTDQSQTSANPSWTSLGWMGAGAFFNSIAGTQAAIESAVTDGLPTVSSPDIEHINGQDIAFTGQESPKYRKVLESLDSFESWAHDDDTTQPTPYHPSTSSSTDACSQSQATVIAELTAFEQSLGENSAIDALAKFVDLTAQKNCLWGQSQNAQNGPAGFSLGITLGSNPFAELIRLGHANLNVSYALLGDTIKLEAFSVAGKMIGGPLLNLLDKDKEKLSVQGLKAFANIGAAGFQLFASIVGFLGLIFFAAGFMLAFFLPLIPFIKFFFNALSWVATVLEAIVMVPLIALAHINPEGDGLPGASAKQAYFFILNIFLRPALMVFGLMCGLLIFLTAVAFLNKMYSLALIGIAGDENPHLVLSKLIFSTIYVILLYIAANNSFKLIHAFPDNALLWIGQNPHRRESLGEAEDLGGKLQLASSYAGQQLFSSVQSSGKDFGANITNALTKQPKVGGGDGGGGDGGGGGRGGRGGGGRGGGGRGGGGRGGGGRGGHGGGTPPAEGGGGAPP